MGVREDTQCEDGICHDALGSSERISYAFCDDSEGSRGGVDLVEAGVSPDGGQIQQRCRDSLGSRLQPPERYPVSRAQLLEHMGQDRFVS
jgi:hypothetical protein